MKIIVFPLNENPYQKYLYDIVEQKIGSQNVIFFKDIDTTNRLSFVKAVLFWPFKLFLVKGKEKVFHIHWQFFYFLFNKKIRTVPSVMLTLWSLGWVKLLGFKIIWTVHDYSQHELNATLDKIIRNVLIYLSDGFIVLNGSTALTLKNKDHIESKKIKLIPIGNYGSDPSYIERKNKKFTFLFFGLVRKYKGVERLISVFKNMSEKDIELRIIGDCYDKKYFEELKSLAKKDARIYIKDMFLDETDLSKEIHNSDIVVLPFLEITNSSSAILAYSKGRPVIAPYIGSFRDGPLDAGYLYKENTEEELEKAMKTALDQKNGLDKMGKNALVYAKTLDWFKTASDTIKFYKSLFKEDT